MYQAHQATQSGLKPAYTEGSLGKINLFIGFAVGGVVGSNNINYPLLKATD